MGYRFVNLYQDDMNKPVYIKVHRLVAETFISGPRNETVNHRNGVKLDNTVSNLEWMSRAENSSHAWRIGLVPILKGERCGKSVLSDKIVLQMRARYSSGETQTSIAARYGVTQANVSEIVRRRTWKHI